MRSKLKLYLVNIKYVRDLSKKDTNVMSVSPQNGKDDRPFLGIVFPVDNDNKKKYCIPLSSVEGKEKHKNAKSTEDKIYVRDLSRKDENGANPAIGVLNVNNMIPVDDCVIMPIDIKVYANDSKSVKNNKIWRTKELDWCQKNAGIIEKKAKKIYKLVVENPKENIRLVKRCCKFDVLESVLEKWKQKD